MKNRGATGGLVAYTTHQAVMGITTGLTYLPVEIGISTYQRNTLKSDGSCH